MTATYGEYIRTEFDRVLRDAELPFEPGIDEETLRLYSLTVRHDRLDSETVAREADIPRELAEDVLARLCAARLIRPVDDDGARFEPASPEWAEAELLTPVLAELYAKQRFFEETRKTLRRLGDVYRTARRPSAPDAEIEILPPGTSTKSTVYRLAQDCAVDFAGTQLNGTAALVTDRLPSELDMARRGVNVRTLLQHSALGKLAVQSYVNKLTSAQGQVRTVPQLWFQVSIFDHKVVLISASPSDESTAGAVLIRNAVIAARVHEVFEHLWSTASADTGSPQELASSELRTAIAQMLASGATDEVSARRLGMSLRTYRRHVAHLMTELGARTRFQAGLLSRDAGLLPGPYGR